MKARMTINRKSQTAIINLKHLNKNLPLTIKKSLPQLLNNTKKFIKDKIKEPPKTGRIYTFQGRRHQASRTGEYSANRSGALEKSINTKLFNFEGKIGSNVKHGLYQEQGTRKFKARHNILQGIQGTRFKNLNILFNNTKGLHK